MSSSTYAIPSADKKSGLTYKTSSRTNAIDYQPPLFLSSLPLVNIF